ncbi:hypothetical protein HYR99_03900 [Candidatus Poribacteria bacterium]|nr:hypothetical protein [Candidatus Poribacteria bacterium]
MFRYPKLISVLYPLWFYLLIFGGIVEAQVENTVHGELSILFTDRFRGRLQSDAYHLGLDAFETPIRQHQSEIGAENLIAIDLGNSVAPFYLSRMDKGQSMLEALVALGYDVMVPGSYEFEYGADFFQSASVGEEGISMLCANLLRPDGKPFLPPYRILERGGLKIAILGIMDVEMRKHILDENFVIPSDKTQTTELQLAEPFPVMKNLISHLKQSVDFIILISNFPYEKNLELAHQLPEINLIIGKQGARFREQRTEVRAGGDENESRTLVVTAEDYLGRIDIRWETANEPINGANERISESTNQILTHHVSQPAPIYRGFTFHVTNFQRIKAERKRQPSPWLIETIEKLERQFQAYCQSRYGRPPDAALCQLPPDITEEELARFVLYVMLFRTHSELGLIHHRHFDFSYWKEIVADHQLTIRECFLLMPENHGLLTVRLLGQVLNQLSRQSRAEKAVNRDYLHFLSVKPMLDGQGKWFVHRLPIRDNELYASCSINVLINGSSVFQGLTTGTHVKTKFKMTSYLRFFPDGKTKIIRDVLIDYLRERPPEQLMETGSQLTELTYLQRPLWRLQIPDTGVSFNSNRARNSQTYPNVTIPELQKAEITALRLQGQAKVTRETALLLWENLLQTELGQIKVGLNPFREDKDELSVSTNLIFKFLNITTGVRPFAGLRLDTEFTREERREHQQDLIVRTGVTLPDGWFFSSSRLSYSRIIDLNTGRTKRKGLNALNLDTQVMILRAGRGVRWTTTLQGTYFLADTTANSERRQFLMKAESALKIPVVQNLSVAPTFEAIIFKGMDEPTLAQAYLFSMRFSYFKDWKWQYMRYFLRGRRE